MLIGEFADLSICQFVNEMINGGGKKQARWSVECFAAFWVVISCLYFAPLSIILRSS